MRVYSSKTAVKTFKAPFLSCDVYFLGFILNRHQWNGDKFYATLDEMDPLVGTILSYDVIVSNVTLLTSATLD